MNEIFAPTLPEAWYAGAEDPDSRDHCQLLGSDQAFRGSLPLAAFCPCTETGIVEQALRPRLKAKLTVTCLLWRVERSWYFPGIGRPNYSTSFCRFGAATSLFTLSLCNRFPGAGVA
jgi:hypothetical protein